jgi:hypothetical protein
VRHLRRAFLGSLAVGVSLACVAGPEVILRTADGAKVTARELDASPLQLLPPSSIAWLFLDVRVAAQSEIGQALVKNAKARFMLPEAAGFSFDRDVSSMSVALYSLQGADFVGVASGHFDVSRISAAALEYRGGPLAPGLVRSEYAGRTLFTAQNVGFSILTPQTALFGNEVGMRRCLDRIASGRVQNDLPAWVRDLLAAPQATFSSGIDLASSAVSAGLPERLALLEGASRARVVGTFEPPGINLAGSIHYADPLNAGRSATALLRVGSSLNVYAQLLGFGQPIRKLETRAVGTDTQLAASVDGAAAQLLMNRFLPAPEAPAQHTGPGWALSAARRDSARRLARAVP